MNKPYPEGVADRDAWILQMRRRVPVEAARQSLDPYRPQGVLRERERQQDGRILPGWTVFLTNRECPWRCLMCDLWKQTLETDTPTGAITRQIKSVLKGPDIQPGHDSWIKLYNAGSFFDTRAVPQTDADTVSSLVGGFGRVIVESHPRLIGGRTWRFQQNLGRAGTAKLEVALGLETVHPSVLERLNKRFTVTDCERAIGDLKDRGADVRVFILIRPPFLGEQEALDWACRSLDAAFDWGADVATLIPVRFGNGALEALAAQGLFQPPSVETVLATFQYGLESKRGRVFLDLWDLERWAPDPAEQARLRTELEWKNLRG